MRLTADLRDLAAVPAFRTLLAVRLVSQTGDGMVQPAWRHCSSSGRRTWPMPPASPPRLVVMLLPFSTIGPFAGPFIDRWSAAS